MCHNITALTENARKRLCKVKVNKAWALLTSLTILLLQEPPPQSVLISVIIHLE